MLLLLRVRSCADDAEYEMLRQQWDSVNRPQYQRRTWSPRQEEALGAVAYAVGGDDLEEAYQTMPGYPLDDPLELNDIESFQEGEIFWDDKRGEGFIEPLSRLRLRQVRYYEDRPDDDGVQLAIPEEKVYGKKIPGFRETIFDCLLFNKLVL